MARPAWGDGFATLNKSGEWLDVFFDKVALGSRGRAVSRSAPATARVAGIRSEPCSVAVIDLDESPSDVGDAYLRLHLLSHRLVRPNEINLDGIFAVLPNVCWTSVGPIDPSEVDEIQLQARRQGQFVGVR